MDKKRYLAALARICRGRYFNARRFLADPDSAAFVLARDLREHLFIEDDAAKVCAEAVRAALTGTGEINKDAYITFIAQEIAAGNYVEKRRSNSPVTETALANECIALPGVPWTMSKYEVLQHEFERLMGYNPSYIQGSNFPVENIGWYEAIEYCNKRSIAEGLPCAYAIFKKNKKIVGVTLNIPVSGYRLPTAKEWEYAARAGTTTDWYTGGYKTINPSLANYNAQHICKAGQFPPNPWGLYDMYGNVWEWCFDRHIFFHMPGNPWGEHRILRGGSYREGSTSCSSKSFKIWEPERHGYIGPMGFRLVKSR